MVASKNFTASARAAHVGTGSSCLSHLLNITLRQFFDWLRWSAAIVSKVLSGTSRKTPMLCQSLANGRSLEKAFFKSGFAVPVLSTKLCVYNHLSCFKSSQPLDKSC